MSEVNVWRAISKDDDIFRNAWEELYSGVPMESVPVSVKRALEMFEFGYNAALRTVRT